MATTQAPTATTKASQVAVPDDASDPTQVLINRFQAFKHVVKNLQDYVSALEKHEETSSKEYHKAANALQVPVKDANVFEQKGLQDVLVDLKDKTIRIANDRQAHSKQIKEVINDKILEKLHQDIKQMITDLEKGAHKGEKNVSKARLDTKKHIENLGKHSASWSTQASGLKVADDPFLLHRSVRNRLEKQVQEENNHNKALVTIQNDCSRFEGHVVKTIQDAFEKLAVVNDAASKTLVQSFDGIAKSVGQLPPDHEWNGFAAREKSLVNPSVAARNADDIDFDNKNHEATKPLIAGDLFRKTKFTKRYTEGYYVITPSKFLHEFKSADHVSSEKPDLSIYLPDCVIGGHSNQASGKAKFEITGKESKLISTKHNFQFKASSFETMLKWWETARKAAGANVDDKIPTFDDEGDESEGTSEPPSRKVTEGTVPKETISSTEPTTTEKIADTTTPVKTAGAPPSETVHGTTAPTNTATTDATAAAKTASTTAA